MADYPIISNGTYVVVGRTYIGTVTDIAIDPHYPESGDSALYLVERDTFFGTKKVWIRGYELAVINRSKP